MKTVRCAIYTRKSSEDGLEQAFNSLDAQREACAAYVLSQASEGWSALPDIYDDGGLSGGSLGRPALQRLLAEVAAGNIDIIVVYKVDRLTRSLLDFAKLVEAFDKAGTSFVSVTQSFNTTTSMGRLTLNMLLSFAQFEREVTAERIRDKIAASKAKGMWMDGTPPLGYKPDGRSLSVVEDDAEVVRDIYRRYLSLGNVRLVADELARDGVTVPIRATAAGRPFGGGKFFRGHLYAILKNPIYVGDIPHHGKVHKGQHAPILDHESWDRAQAKLADHIRGERRAKPATSLSLLAGLIVDEAGEALVATHACKGRVRYRYYVSRALQHGEPRPGEAGVRMPAREIEAAVVERTVDALADPLMLASQASITLEASTLRQSIELGLDTAAKARSGDREIIRRMVTQVRIFPDRIEIDLSTGAIANFLDAHVGTDVPAAITLTRGIRLTRTGRAVRLVQNDGSHADATLPDATLIRLMLRAQGWWAQLKAGDLDIMTLATNEGVTASYVTRVVRLAFLAPAVVEKILSGGQLATIDGGALTATAAIPIDWSEQHRALLPAAC